MDFASSTRAAAERDITDHFGDLARLWDRKE